MYGGMKEKEKEKEGRVEKPKTPGSHLLRSYYDEGNIQIKEKSSLLYKYILQTPVYSMLSTDSL